MRLDALFDVSYGHKLDMNKMTQCNKEVGFAFVGRRGSNQGVSGYVKKLKDVNPHPPGAITVALGGSFLLSAFVQQGAFYTAQNVAILNPLDPNLPLKHKLFYAMCITRNRFRYSAFGREANRTLSTLIVPDTVPGWVEETDVPSHDGLCAPLGDVRVDIELDSWRSVKIENLFDVKKGKRVTKSERKPGATRFIGASEKKNGVTDFCNLEPIFPGGVLTVPYNGNSVGWAFYQDRPFFACDDVNVLVPRKPMSKWALLFIASVLRHGKHRYTYGYKWTKGRMEKTPIKLPFNSTGDLDLEYMEGFMKSLSFSSVLERAGSEDGSW